MPCFLLLCDSVIRSCLWARRWSPIRNNFSMGYKSLTVVNYSSRSRLLRMAISKVSKVCISSNPVPALRAVLRGFGSGILFYIRISLIHEHV
ncbi:hypothetical protein MPTK1_4g06860 [Marchantia polymorpha subsp. ruderalis]|uniref:Uncharacterized protein n=2 Tax=Marchantia polymorpha TaxID=3197 RepID=A0AAF6B779_MARPO|nr:hypothetical protein MARPO_0125s0031 [Marchantia polymorpha]BBN07863.1 hypothetical protein Mp_4g06860 [Marchantia polymorpha subsp. ruderalis]|eukprot:PTQ30397.1 hypothetical protein MARPO_0125s0031 [Marchantia polymorpha]